MYAASKSRLGATAIEDSECVVCLEIFTFAKSEFIFHVRSKGGYL